MLGDSVRRRQPQRRTSAGRRPGGPRRWPWRPLLIAVPLALVLPFLIGYLLAVFVFFPPRELAAAGIAVPQLVGYTELDAQRAISAAGLGTIEPTELPHPSAPAGLVIAQSPLPGQHLRPGADVRVAVSAGRPHALVPDVQGFSAERAESLLRRSGFDVTVASQESPLPAGRVLRTEPERGRDQVLPAVVTLIVSAGPPAPEPQDTLPTDTLDMSRLP
jgi:hypothetical protein